MLGPPRCWGQGRERVEGGREDGVIGVPNPPPASPPGSPTMDRSLSQWASETPGGGPGMDVEAMGSKPTGGIPGPELVTVSTGCRAAFKEDSC